MHAVVIQEKRQTFWCDQRAVFWVAQRIETKLVQTSVKDSEDTETFEVRHTSERMKGQRSDREHRPERDGQETGRGARERERERRSA